MKCHALAAIVGFWIAVASAATSIVVDDPADDIIKRSGVFGGFASHVGCGDGRLTASLGAKEKFTVHGLDHHSGSCFAYVTTPHSARSV